MQKKVSPGKPASNIYDPVVHTCLLAPSKKKPFWVERERMRDDLEKLWVIWTASLDFPLHKKHQILSANVVDWVEKTPIIKEWLSAKKDWQAASFWPKEVTAAFHPLPVPSPYELANRTRGVVLTKIWCTHEIHVLRAYASGMDLDLLSSLMKKKLVIDTMVQGVEQLKLIPRAVAWCCNVDLKASPLLLNMQGSLLTKVHQHAQLEEDPFAFTKREGDKLFQSPRFLKYAIGGCIPQRKTTRPLSIIRIYPSSEERQWQEEQKVKSHGGDLLSSQKEKNTHVG